jgi:crotonobetainyl-CoA:carnitine CoA-transferase CaiB-like acyl-CoA transferase
MFEGLYSDVVSALTTVLSALAALDERARSGRGQVVDVSQWEATLALAAEVVIHRGLVHEEMGSVGFGHPLLCPSGNYPTRASHDDDPASRWVSVSVDSPEEWRSLLAVIDGESSLPGDAPDWDKATRRSRRHEIDAAIARWTQTRDRHEAARELQAAGVASLAVQSIADLLEDPQFAHREAFIQVDHPLVGSEPMPGLPWKLAATAGDIVRHAPLLGQHNKEILMGELHYSDDDYDRLVGLGAVEVSAAVGAAPGSRP